MTRFMTIDDYALAKTPPVQAIQTRYAGCHFRSRLEARWAVYFDTIGIEWEYEPQGVQVTHRLTLADGRFGYLPDFWLPDEAIWVEVKGSLNERECLRLLDAAASLSSNNGSGCHDDGGNDLLLLGSIPRPDQFRRPFRLHFHKGDLQGVPWGMGVEKPQWEHATALAADTGGDNLREITEGLGLTHPECLGRLLCQGITFDDMPPNVQVAQALEAARSARFEHGQSGAS